MTGSHLRVRGGLLRFLFTREEPLCAFSTVWAQDPVNRSYKDCLSSTFASPGPLLYARSRGAREVNNTCSRYFLRRRSARKLLQGFVFKVSVVVFFCRFGRLGSRLPRGLGDFFESTRLRKGALRMQGSSGGWQQTVTRKRWCAEGGSRPSTRTPHGNETGNQKLLGGGGRVATIRARTRAISSLLSWLALHYEIPSP